MNTVELIGTAYEPAANSGPGWGDASLEHARSQVARGFLIQLVAREVQLNDFGATWLQEVATQLSSLAEPGSRTDYRTGAEACAVLANETRALRAKLVALAHRLVARRNQISPQRCVDVFALLAQPRSLAFIDVLEMHQQNLAGREPWIELAALRPIEQMLAGVVPLAIEVVGVDDGDLREAAELFGTRTQRASLLSSLLRNLVAVDAGRLASVRAAEDRAIATFTNLLSECAEIGRQLDSWRHGFVR